MSAFENFDPFNLAAIGPLSPENYEDDYSDLKFPSFNQMGEKEKKEVKEDFIVPTLLLLLPEPLPDLRQTLPAYASLQRILQPRKMELEIPEDYLCPITRELMRDPVNTSDGQTYEREAIERWLKRNTTSPATGSVLESKQLAPVVFAQKMIHSFVEKHPELKDAREWYLPQSWMVELEQACQAGNVKAIQELVGRDRRLLTHSFDKEPYKGKTALHLAAGGHPRALECVVELLEKRAQGLGLAALLQVDAAGHLPFHKALLAKQTPEILLKISAWMGSAVEQVKKMGAALAEAQNALDAALSWSVLKQDSLKLQCFLRLGANPQFTNIRGESLVYLAVEKGCIDSVKLLLEAGADSNAFDERLDDTALHVAVYRESIEMVTLLKAYGVRLDKALKDGSTPLHVAAEQKTSAVSEILYAEEKVLTPALLEAPDAQGCTPLHRAVTAGSVEMVKWLLQKSASVTATNHLRQTALHEAAYHNQGAIVQALLDAKASLTMQDKMGNTPLHRAAQVGASEIAILLLEASASSSIKNEQGQTSRQLALTQGHTQTVTQIDKTIHALREKEEQALRSQGILGLTLLNQQRLLEEQRLKLEQQQEQIDALLREKEQQREEINRLKQTKLEATVWEEFKSSPQRILSALQKGKKTSKKVPEKTKKKRKAEEGHVYEMEKEAKARLVVEKEQKMQAQLEEFLKYVVEGEQDQAEALLKTKPELALGKGMVTDLSKREFKSISGFQYAVWAGDWHMWKMVLKYLAREAAAEQFAELEEKETAYGKHFDLKPLIEALDTYVDQRDLGSGLTTTARWNTPELGKHWCEVIGGNQRLLPVCVVNQYCHPQRGFYPTPKFNEETLPRSRKCGAGEWFTGRCDSGLLGETFAIIGSRTRSRGAQWCSQRLWIAGNSNTYLSARHVGEDSLVIRNLLAVRQQQLAELRESLNLNLNKEERP